MSSWVEEHRKMQEAERAAGALSKELVTLDLIRFRDLVVPLAERYPDSGVPLEKVVDNALRHLRDGLLIVQRQGALQRRLRGSP